jgi:hypothetical protein
MAGRPAAGAINTAGIIVLFAGKGEGKRNREQGTRNEEVRSESQNLLFPFSGL